MSTPSGSPRASLLRNGRFVRLWVGQSVSFVGDTITLVALVVLVADLTGSAASVGGVLVARLLPTLASPLVGVLADRLRDRRWLLVGVDVFRAAVLLSIIFVESVVALYPLVFLLGVCQTLFNPTIRSAFPGVVAGGDLTRANALISGSFSLAVATGPALGGVLVALVGVDAAFLIDALTFLVSAAFLLFVPMPSSRGAEGPATGEPGGESEESFVSELGAGFAYLRRARLPLGLVIGALLLLLAENSTVPAEPFLARDTFGAGEAGYGFLVASYGVGMVLGSAAMALLGDRAKLLVVYFASIAVACASLATVGVAPTFALVLAAFAVAGTCNGLDNVTTDALLQKRVPESFLGRVYSVLFLFRSVGEVAALAAGGFIVVVLGPQDSYLLAAAAMLLFGIVILAIIRPTRSRKS
ncbi:Transmembrane secretion effector [Rubrobacter radiotolerans]|uniref:MFS transporter n=1 Tax=Rubrobacter radiotolerans TaxID=42256 RepID=A0A023X210_RUBRA|nr:MFS transporter [Rubrobacter radiotolerans]AHY46251.1 Transmembrane secretion effector [Rubrobacter radiotolerans]MDX5893659.1 MFS transporter [Rubrobacter radiotolerans]SMC04223.1 Predicted arabinose efflux permease, MFS family [Rubrobacter radiotolerans DSM 5868]